MKYCKYISVKVEYDSLDIWEETEKDIKDMLEMVNNISRKVIILNIEQGADCNVNDGQDQ